MAHHNWMGPGKLEATTHDRAVAPTLTEPATTVVAGVEETHYKCIECGKTYRKAMLIARHFNSTHAELKKDSETWREYMEIA